MINRIAVLFFMILPWYGITQSGEYKDVIQLVNGSILTGKLLKYTADTIQIALTDTETTTLHTKNVKKVKMASPSFRAEELYRFKSPTWYLRSQFSMLYSRNQGGFSLSVSGGYQINHWFAAGLGTGIDNYYASEGFNIYPVYGEIRLGFYRKNKSPYLGVRAGYGFASADKESGQTHANGGWCLNPVLGYRLGAGRPYIDIYAGARLQSAYYTSANGQFQSDINVDFRRYDLGLGLTF